MDKSNVLESHVVWRETVTRLHADRFHEVSLSHIYGDACAMEMLRNPKAFDVLLTDNFFGDILSDEGAMLTGSIGMLPSACLGAKGANGRFAAVYEPIHGSAPDLAGTGAANPLAAILCVAMMFRFSFGLEEEAKRIQQAVTRVLGAGVRTKDLTSGNHRYVSTREMGNSVISALGELANE